MQGSVHITMATWKELEEMAENQSPTWVSQNKWEILSAELQTSGWNAHEEAGGVEQWREGQNELPGCSKPRKPDFNKSGCLHAFSQCCC